MKHAHALPFGATLRPEGGTRFRVWAPGQAAVQLALHGAGGTRLHAMRKSADGWHEALRPEAGAGTRYQFVMAGGLAVPDPASRSNPDDVHGPSVVVDPHAYRWHDATWHGRPWHEAVVYELHVGCFTPEGTYAAARERLPELAALGISCIELLPLADFPGARGWGYDGVLPYAPDASYGSPDQLKALVDRAHALGLMVLLDVVYNHFGPEGNYLHAWCPEFFNPAHQTPWGAAINFDGAHNRTVRDYFVHNALYWVEEFRFDGLRLDAVHAMRDDSGSHIACEIADALRAGPGRERALHVVLENDLNQARHLARDADGRPRCASAQWNDDFHHAGHVLVTAEDDGYYRDYADAPLARLGRCLAEGFAWQGEPSALRDGAPRGEPSAALPPAAFVSFLQNHDQIGNRAFGERIDALADRGKLEAALACLLLAPQVPLLFMGEEWAASTPFLYFCDFGPELAQAVSDGRRAEFQRFAAFRDPAARARIPDPNAEASFLASKLRWDERERGVHAERLALVRRLLALRRECLGIRLAGARGGATYRVRGGLLEVAWPLDGGARWHLVANFGDAPAAAPDAPAGSWLHVLPLADDRPAQLAPGAVRVRLEPAGG